MKSRTLPPTRRKLLDLTAFRELPFLTFTAGTCLGFLAYYTPFYYIQAYSQHYHVDENLSLYLVSIMNASSILGRLLPNFIADKIGSLNVLIPCFASAGIVAFCWLEAKNTGGLIIFAILYGFFTGTFVSLPPSVLVGLSPSLSVIRTRMGMSFAINGVGLLIRTPVASVILNERG
jgi:MFS family permease